jgi:hypothetical protein
LENIKINPNMPQVSVKDGAIQMATDVYAPSNGIIYYAVWSEEDGQDDIKWYPDTGTGITSADLKNHSGYGRYTHLLISKRKDDWNKRSRYYN